MTKKPKTDVAASKSRALQVKGEGADLSGVVGANLATWAIAPAADVVAKYARPAWGEVCLAQVVAQLRAKADAVQGGDLKEAEAMLIAQAVALNTMFAELASRAQLYMGEHTDAMDTYMRLALRAQNQCRTTLETLAAIKNPPVVFAKQANIANGPQQVNNGAASRVEKIENRQTELLEHDHEQWLDSRATAATNRSHSPLEAVATVDRATQRRSEGKDEP